MILNILAVLRSDVILMCVYHLSAMLTWLKPKFEERRTLPRMVIDLVYIQLSKLGEGIKSIQAKVGSVPVQDKIL